MEVLEQASKAIQKALLDNKKIYFYGCGATGRLAKQVESAFCRPFWASVKMSPEWGQLKTSLPHIENRLIGEMTGADRALVSSLEGFEDLPIDWQITARRSCFSAW